MIATVRGFASVKYFIKFPYHAIACMNGAVTFIEDVLFDKTNIDRTQTQRILNWYKEKYPNGFFTVAISDTNYESYIKEERKGYKGVKLFSSEILMKENVNRIVLDIKPYDFEQLRNFLSDELYLGDEELAVIWPKQATKLRSIELVAKHYNIKKEEIVAFGDSDKDIEML